MKRVLFLTNYPSPYRVRFFDELGKRMDVTVLFADRIEDKKHRNSGWYVPSQGSFQSVQLKKTLAVKSNSLCLEVTGWLKKDFDAIVVCGYSNPTAIYAMAWMRSHKIPFWMEVDGGLIRQDSLWKHRLKSGLVCCADKWLSSGKYTTRYLAHYGAKEENIAQYPFSSLEEGDILPTIPAAEEKAALREELGISEPHCLLAIGQFIHRKGFDVLLKAAASLPKSAGIYIVGGEPTEEYLQLRQELGLTNVHFLGFQSKETLVKFYKAADVFVLPTREDIWGLVINEAMAYGLPVITTDRCVAGLELVEDGVNGYIVPVGNVEALAEKMNRILEAGLPAMGAASLEKIRPYTIENMAKVHAEIFENGR